MCKASFVPATAGDTFDDEWGATQAQCYSDDTAAENLPAVEASITAGIIHYDATAAAACLAGITYPSCMAFWAASGGATEPPACDAVLDGTVADGGACTNDWDCSGDTSVCDATTKKCAPDTAPRTLSGGVGHKRVLGLR